MFCHNVSYTYLEALGSLCAWNQNNELKLLCAPEIFSKYLKVPMDSLVLETAATQQGLGPDKGIEPVHVRCMPITVFCQKPSHHCSTCSRSKSYRCSISLLTAISLWAIPWLKQAVVEMRLTALPQLFAVMEVFPCNCGVHRTHKTLGKEWKGICFKHQYLVIFKKMHLIWVSHTEVILFRLENDVFNCKEITDLLTWPFYDTNKARTQWKMQYMTGVSTMIISAVQVSC